MYDGSQHISRNIRSAAILTGSYVAATTIECNGMTQLLLYIDFTKGNLTTLNLTVDFSEDNSTFYQESLTQADFGNSTVDVVINQYDFDATGKFRLAIPVLDKFVKVSVKGTGTATSSSCTLDYVMGTN